MYLDFEGIFYFIVLPILGLIGMFIYARQREQEVYKLKEKYKDLKKQNEK